MHDNFSAGAWIAWRATATPDRTAVVFRDRRFSYRELDGRARRLAAVFRRAGIGVGDRVVFAVNNEPSALETLFACGLVGSVAAPVNPALVGPEMKRVLDDVAPRALVAAGTSIDGLDAVDSCRTAFRLTTGAGRAGWLDYEASIASSEPLSSAANVDLDDLSLVARTSGTSGPSKGIELTHANLLFNAFNLLTCLDCVRDDVILTSAPLHRMGSWGFLLPILLKGGACVLQEAPSARESLRLIAQHGVTVLFDSVAALEALVRDPDFAGPGPRSLRICVTGGTRVPATLVEAFRERGLALHAGYGLSEASPVVALPAARTGDLAPGNVGVPVPFCSARVANADGEDVPEGVAGEVLLRGLNVMRGYTDARATERAVRGGWVRTGDAGIRSPDGALSILGRVADALTVGGRTAYPEPIEAELRTEPGVSECLIVQEAPAAPIELWVVPGSDAALDEARLLAACRARLGSDAPLRLRLLPSLPRNPNGKPVRRFTRAAEEAP